MNKRLHGGLFNSTSRQCGYVFSLVSLEAKKALLARAEEARANLVAQLELENGASVN